MIIEFFSPQYFHIVTEKNISRDAFFPKIVPQNIQIGDRKARAGQSSREQEQETEREIAGEEVGYGVAENEKDRKTAVEGVREGVENSMRETAGAGAGEIG